MTLTQPTRSLLWVAATVSQLGFLPPLPAPSSLLFTQTPEVQLLKYKSDHVTSLLRIHTPAMASHYTRKKSQSVYHDLHDLAPRNLWCHLSWLLPSFVLLEMHCPLRYPYNTASMHSPQCLCTSYFFCLEYSTPQLSPWLVSSLHSSLYSNVTWSKKPSLAGLSKIVIPSVSL